MKALIFAAGLGTRLRPLTNSIPKALIPVGGKTLLEQLILKLKAAGFRHIVINVHHFADQIIRFIAERDSFGIDIQISDERDCLLETGGALRKAATWLQGDEAILLHNVDILSNADLGAFYRQHDKNSLATLLVSSRETKRYFLFDAEERLRAWIHTETGEVKPAGFQNIASCHKLAFSGIQVVSPKIFNLLEGFPERFSIIDLYLSQAEKYSIKGFTPQHFSMIDIGKIDALKAAENFFRRELLA